MAFTGKRNGGLGLDSTPAKAQKGPRPDDAEQWSCAKCGNLNYGNRMVCNMRSCGAPKDQEEWSCAGCGNNNFASRLYCNMRRCQQIRPGVTMQQLAQANHMEATKGGGGGGGKGGAGYAAMAPQMMGGGGKGMPLGAGMNDPRTQEPGCWTCSCGNLNFPGRESCNSRSCGKAKPQGGQWAYVPPAYAQQQQAYAQPVYAAPAYSYTPSGPPMGGSKPPEGAWQCISCKNVNWPTRDKCNAKTCGQPRHLVDGGQPEASAPLGARHELTGPPGSWACPSCSNLNYPTRTSCNKRGCGIARPM